jgi:hypothetical protein
MTDEYPETTEGQVDENLSDSRTVSLYLSETAIRILDSVKGPFSRSRAITLLLEGGSFEILPTRYLKVRCPICNGTGTEYITDTGYTGTKPCRGCESTGIQEVSYQS